MEPPIGDILPAGWVWLSGMGAEGFNTCALTAAGMRPTKWPPNGRCERFRAIDHGTVGPNERL